MEFTGRIKKVLPLRSGISQRTGNEWKVQSFVFEYFENPTDRYSDTVVVETMNPDYIAMIKEDLPVRVGFGHHADEYNGNYYNKCRVYTMEAVGEQQPVAAATGTGASADTPAVETAGGAANKATSDAGATQQTTQEPWQQNDPLPF